MTLDSTVNSCASEIVRYLRSKEHTDAPHISTLSPDYYLKKKLMKESKLAKHTLVQDPDEENEQEYTDEQDLLKARGTSTFGVSASFNDFSVESVIRFDATFSFRVSMHEPYFRKWGISVTINPGMIVKVELLEIMGSDATIASTREFKTQNAKNGIVIGFGNKSAASVALHRLPWHSDYACRTLMEEKGIKKLEIAPGNYEVTYEDPTGRMSRSKDLFFEEPFAHTFLLEITMPTSGGGRFEVILRHLGCIATQKGSFYYANSLQSPENKFDRWSVKYLMEVEGELSWKHCKPAWEWSHLGIKGLTPIGCLPVEEEEKVLLRDWHIANETIRKIKLSNRTLEESIGEAIGNYPEKQRICQMVTSAISRVYGKNLIRLYTYQDEALSKIYKALLNHEMQGGNAFVMQARTAGGKTLAFLLPILAYLVRDRIINNMQQGTQFLLMYPTVALAYDQADEALGLVYHINKALQDGAKPISIGILNEYVISRYRINEAVEFRINCPECGNRLEMECNMSKKEGSFIKERLICRNANCPTNSDQKLNQLLNKTLFMSRESIYSQLPDLLVTTPDFVNARLTLQGQEDPGALSIIGKMGYRCNECGKVYWECKRVCIDGCKSKNIERLIVHSPLKAIIIDEAHMFKGAFGVQVAHLLMRLEGAIKNIFSDHTWRPLYLLSSATLSNAEARVRELTRANSVIKLEAEEEGEGVQTNYRTHVILMPKTYAPAALLERALEVPFGATVALPGVNGKLNAPKALVFMNTLAETNEVIGSLKRLLSQDPNNVRVGGHTTDWGRERAIVEDDFLRGKLDVLVATRGLEVGVDYGMINVGAVFGLPFYLSDYTQRIGRIGRKEDSLIIDILRPDNNINYYYFMNWKLLCDSSLREEHLRAESYKINTQNPIAISRTIQRAIMDWISVTFPTFASADSENLKAEAMKYVERVCLDPLCLNEAAKEGYLSKAEKIFSRQYMASSTIKSPESVLSDLRKISQTKLWGLRSLEDHVEILLPSGSSRTKDLKVMFRRSMEGMIYSYRGTFYVVNSVDAEPVRIVSTGNEEN